MGYVHPLWRWLTYKISEISSLSEADYVNIVGTYTYMSNDRKESNLEARGYSEQAIAAARKYTIETFNPITSCGLRFTKPLDNFKYTPIGYVLTLFEAYERGCLPFPGAMSEQPGQILEIFGLLRELRREQEQRKNLERNNGRKQHQNQPRVGR